jgi:hypothetical protein
MPKEQLCHEIEMAMNDSDNHPFISVNLLVLLPHWTTSPKNLEARKI